MSDPLLRYAARGRDFPPGYVLDVSPGPGTVVPPVSSVEVTAVADRIECAHAAIAAGLDPASVPVLEEAFTRDGGRACARRVLAEHPGTTAVVALDDDMAINVLAELRSAGVSVTGFDDVAAAGDLAPGLTTVQLPMAEMGAKALALALKPPSARPRRTRLPATLVARGSTGPVAGRGAGR